MRRSDFVNRSFNYNFESQQIFHLELAPWNISVFVEEFIYCHVQSVY